MFLSDLLTVSEFCQWSRIGRTKFYAEVRAGSLRAIKIGRRTFVERKDADAWLASRPQLGAFL